MFKLIVHNEAAIDLDQIKESGDLASHGVLLAFLQQAKADLKILDHLQDDGYGEDNTTSFSIRKWIEQSRKGRPLWRIKVFNVKGLVVPYRIIYAVYPRKEFYAVLAILARSVNYEESHPRVQQLIATYSRVALNFSN